MKDDAMVEGPNEQVVAKMEGAIDGEEVTQVLHAHLRPVQLTPIPTGNLITVPARMSPLSTTSQPLTTPAYIHNSTPVVHRASTMTSMCSFVNPISPPTSLSPKRQHRSQDERSRSTTPLDNNTPLSLLN